MSASAGFPMRPLRDDFGPEPVNRYPVRNAEHELDGETTGRLMFHQLTGLGLLSDLVELVITTADGLDGEITVLSRVEAWNTRAVAGAPYEPPTLHMESAGVITIAYPSQVPDWSGTLQPLTFRGGSAQFIDDDENVYGARVIPSSPPNSLVKVRAMKHDGGAWVESNGKLLILLR